MLTAFLRLMFKLRVWERKSLSQASQPTQKRSEMIETAVVDRVTQGVRQAVLDELAVEDRINDKVREYMNQYADEIRRGGLSYHEMFKRIKSELVRREKVIL